MEFAVIVFGFIVVATGNFEGNGSIVDYRCRGVCMRDEGGEGVGNAK